MLNPVINFRTPQKVYLSAYPMLGLITSITSSDSRLLTAATFERIVFSPDPQ